MNEPASPVIDRELHWVETTDGARLAMLRRRAAADPVILIHGLAVNADIWDLPPLAGEGWEFRSLSRQLMALGHDVWLLNLRGHGGPGGRSAPPEGQTDWRVDDFIGFDLPAAIAHVRAETGQAPFVVGSSMGAMALAGVMQGATISTAGAERHMVIDPALAAQRQAEVAGCVYVEFPAALRWPDSLYDENQSLRWDVFTREWLRADARANYPFELMSRSTWAQAILGAMGGVRLDWMRPKGVWAGWRERAPEGVRRAMDKLDAAVASGMKRFAERVKGTQHFAAETFFGGLLPALDHMQAGVLRQMAKSVRARSFVSDTGTPDIDYVEGYPLIRNATLVVLGGADRIACADVTREVFFDRIGAEDKTLQFYPTIAHGDFEYAPIASERVYPAICDWIRQRMASG